MSCKIIVTTSAIICPLDISFKACKWPKPGALFYIYRVYQYY
jgi:hypothetical protein